MAMLNTILTLLLSILVFMLVAIPLHFFVILMNGKTNLLRTAAIMFISGVLVSAIKSYFGWGGGVIAFILLIWIYHEFFRLKWWKALLLWLLSGFLIYLGEILVGFLSQLF